MTARAKVAPSRLSMHTVMANSGFGTLKIHKPEGVTIVIPKNHLTADGRVKKHILKHTQELTRENIEILESKGVRVYVGRSVQD